MRSAVRRQLVTIETDCDGYLKGQPPQRPNRPSHTNTSTTIKKRGLSLQLRLGALGHLGHWGGDSRSRATAPTWSLTMQHRRFSNPKSQLPPRIPARARRAPATATAVTDLGLPDLAISREPATSLFYQGEVRSGVNRCSSRQRCRFGIPGQNSAE